jgi:hypothetical protein
MRFVGMVAVVGVMTISSLGRAQALQAAPSAVADTAVDSSTETVSRWYGAPIFLADGAAYAAMIGGYASDEPEVAIGGLATYVLAGPITHLAYGHPSQAGSSLLLRLVVPVGLGVYSATECKGEREACGNWGVAVGGVGMLLATLIDGASFANDRVKRPAPRVLPTLSLNREGAVIGAVGRF